MTLSQKPQWIGGKLAHTREVMGQEVTVFDSARNVLKVIDLFADTLLPAFVKERVLYAILFPYPEEVQTDQMLSETLWEVCKLDITGTHTVESHAFDWHEDEARIRASLRMAYGIDWDTECDRISFAEACGYLQCLMESDLKTPFQQAVYYRLATPPKSDKYNQGQVADFNAKARHYALESTADQREISNDQSASRMFEALWEVANG